MACLTPPWTESPEQPELLTKILEVVRKAWYPPRKPDFEEIWLKSRFIIEPFIRTYNTGPHYQMFVPGNNPTIMTPGNQPCIIRELAASGPTLRMMVEVDSKFWSISASIEYLLALYQPRGVLSTNLINQATGRIASHVGKPATIITSLDVAGDYSATWSEP